MPNAIALENISDALTLEIVKKIVALPANKKKALLELIGDLHDEQNAENTTAHKRKAELFKNFPSTSQPAKKKGRLSAERKKELLSISVWSDEEIAEIEKARKYINSWTPKSF